MNVYAWSYATLWSAALQAAAGRVRYESPVPSPRVQPRRRQLPARGAFEGRLAVVGKGRS
jgi:hypothetical protein